MQRVEDLSAGENFLQDVARDEEIVVGRLEADAAVGPNQQPVGLRPFKLGLRVLPHSRRVAGIARHHEQRLVTACGEVHLLGAEHREFLRIGDAFQQPAALVKTVRHPIHEHRIGFPRILGAPALQVVIGDAHHRRLVSRRHGVERIHGSPLVRTVVDHLTGERIVLEPVGKRLPGLPDPSDISLAVEPFGQTVEPAGWDAVADYMKRRFFNNSYLVMFSPQSEAHLADGNQLGAYYPVVDRTYWNAMNAAGRLDALADYRTIIRRHWRVLTYPEGQCSDVWNNDPADYSDELGNKQFFSAKSWLADALELNLGLKWSVKGLSFHAIGDGTPFTAENLTLRGKRLDVRLTGKGAVADYVLNGVRLETPFIPWPSLGNANALVITCRGM